MIDDIFEALMRLQPSDVTRWASLTVVVVMTLNAVYLLGFARHRLRAYNVYIVLSIALVAARLYAQLVTGDIGGWWGVGPWVNLAVGSVIGLVGMMRLAAKDPTVWERKRDHEGNP